jgi:Zn2+/Cd2+-exporting ATPase
MRHSERAPFDHTRAAGSGLQRGEGALVAALLHNLSTLLVLANAGRLLRFQEHLPRI